MFGSVCVVVVLDGRQTCIHVACTSVSHKGSSQVSIFFFLQDVYESETRADRVSESVNFQVTMG